MNRLPSLDRLRAAFGRDKGLEVRKLLDGRKDPMDYDAVSDWVNRCYTRHSDDELVFRALNSVLGTFGVEAIEGRWVDRYHMEIQAVYLNTGDTYATTLLLDHETGNVHLTSWGDWVEANERKRELR